MLSLAWLLVVIAVATVLIWKGSIWLESSGNLLSRYYGLPRVVQGAIVAAAGSSFPELASIVIATLLYGSFELGVAAVVGSAIFNVLVIPALSTLAQPDALQANRDLVYKEAQFYLLSVAALLLAFSLAVIYWPLGGDGLAGEFTAELAIAMLGLYGLYIFLQYQDTVAHEPTEEPPSIRVGRQWGFLLLGLVLIFIGVEQLVGAADELGQVFGTEPFLWGLIVIAIGTSLPDAIISLKAARGERHSVSLANVFGSNVFDLLVAVPVGALLMWGIDINFDRVAPMMGFLVAATVVVIGAVRTDFEITNHEAYVLLSIYLGFIGWMLLESLGVLAIVG